MENLYEILEIEKKATTVDIIKKYNLLRSKTLPDRDPDKYHKIWRAYNVLKNDKRRQSYDMYRLLNESIKDLENKADIHIKNKDYAKAEEIFRTLSKSNPDILLFKEKFCKTLYEDQKYYKSLSVMKELISLVPDSSDYYLFYGQIYEKSRNGEAAINSYLKALSIDVENYEAINAIVNYYMKNNAVHEATTFLIHKVYKINSFNYYYFYNICKLIECYVLLNYDNSFNDILSFITIPEDDYYKEYVSWKLIKYAIEMMDSGYELWALKLIEINDKIYPNNRKSNASYNECIYGNMKSFFTNYKTCYTPIKAIILYSSTSYNKQLKEKRKESLQQLLQDFNTLKIDVLKEIEETVQILKDSYLELYYLQNDIFENINIGIKKQIKTTEEYDKFLTDNHFIIPIKKCIKAIEEQNDKKFQRGLSMLGKYSTKRILRNIELFPNYPNLKQRHSMFLNDLSEKCFEIKKG